MAQPWTWVGEHALLRGFDGDLAQANAMAHALADVVRSTAAHEIEDVVPGARSVLVRLRPGAEPSSELLAALGSSLEPRTGEERPAVEIAVRYGGDDGPDLADVARATGLDASEVVRRHAATTYTVAFIGFSPGFAYLLGLPPELATSRLETPRTRIPAGSVGIGGAYTGVYPRETPGGWRLIG
ncbi:MAG: allophanate hydrolase subunit 1, partial [Actinomycetota bacterium]